MNNQSFIGISKAGITRSTGRQLLYVILAGLLVRIIIAFALSRTPNGLRLGDDYILFAEHLIGSHFDYDDPVRCPLTTAISAAAIVVFGSMAEYAVVAFQLLLSMAMIALIYFIAASFLDRRAALLAAALSAADPTLIIFGTSVSSEAIFIPLVSAAIAMFIVTARSSNKAIMAVFLAILLAACQYTRPTGFLLLASFWCASLILAANSTKTMLAVTAIVVACCAPWVIRNGIKYNEYQFTSSYDLNIAALLIGTAKTRMNPELAAGVGAGGNLNIWIPDMHDCPTENGYANARCAKHVALNWAASHKLAVAYYYVRGLALRWLSPPAQRYFLAFTGKEQYRPSLTIPLALWKALVGIFAVTGLWISLNWRVPAAARVATLILGTVFIADYTFQGPVTDSRLFTMDAMLLCPLAAAGLAHFFTKLKHAQKRGEPERIGHAIP